MPVSSLIWTPHLHPKWLHFIKGLNCQRSRLWFIYTETWVTLAIKRISRFLTQSPYPGGVWCGVSSTCEVGDGSCALCFLREVMVGGWGSGHHSPASSPTLSPRPSPRHSYIKTIPPLPIKNINPSPKGEVMDDQVSCFSTMTWPPDSRYALICMMVNLSNT